MKWDVLFLKTQKYLKGAITYSIAKLAHFR